MRPHCRGGPSEDDGGYSLQTLEVLEGEPMTAEEQRVLGEVIAFSTQGLSPQRPLRLEMRLWPVCGAGGRDFRMGDHSLFLVSEQRAGSPRSSTASALRSRDGERVRATQGLPIAPRRCLHTHLGRADLHVKQTTLRVERGPDRGRPKQRRRYDHRESLCNLYEQTSAGESLVAEGTREVNQALEDRLG